MQKINITKKALENVKFSFNGEEVEVIPYISNSTQETLIQVYLSAYFQDAKENRMNAELVNKIGVLDLMTNINIDDFEGTDLVLLLDNISGSGLWEKITKAIKNYREVEFNISVAVDSIKKNKSDIGYVIQKFLDEKVNPILQKFGEFDLTDEKLSQMKGIVSELGEQLKDTPVGNLIKKGTV